MSDRQNKTRKAVTFSATPNLVYQTWTDLESQGGHRMPKVALYFAYAVHYSFVLAKEASVNSLSTHSDGRKDSQKYTFCNPNIQKNGGDLALGAY